MPFLTVAAVLALAVDPACGAARPESDLAGRLVAVATHESGRDTLAINVNGPGGGTRRFTTEAAAKAYAEALEATGASFDAGLMQISRSQWARHGLTLATVFNPCRNMAAGSAHLAANFRAVWQLAHRRYNCGGTDCGVAYAEAIERRVVQLTSEPAAPPPEAGPPPPSPLEDEPLHDALRVHPRLVPPPAPETPHDP